MHELAREMWLNRCFIMDGYDKTKGCIRELTEIEILYNNCTKAEQKSTQCDAF